MLQNAYFVAKIGADTAENDQHSAEILPTDALWRLRRDEDGVVRVEGLHVQVRLRNGLDATDRGPGCLILKPARFANTSVSYTVIWQFEFVESAEHVYVVF